MARTGFWVARARCRTGLRNRCSLNRCTYFDIFLGQDSPVALNTLTVVIIGHLVEIISKYQIIMNSMLTNLH
jgi:hypothetical protein